MITFYKRKKVIIAMGLLVAMFCGCTISCDAMAAQDFAEENTVSDTPVTEEVTEQNHTSVSLQLDNTNVYDGMKKAYKDGYVPTVSKDKVDIVLPVSFEQEVSVNELVARLDLGATEGSPFQYKNYEKTVKKTKEKINGTKKEKEIFLVKFSVKLNKDAINGVYPLTINLSYIVNGENVSQDFPVYVTISEKKSDKNLEITQEAPMVEEKPTSDPKVMITKSECSTKQIFSGSEFTDQITIKNTNKNKYIQNIMITVTCEAEGVSFADGGNVFYYDRLNADSSLEIPVQVKVSEDTPEGKYVIGVSLSYDNPDAVALTGEGKVEFVVYQKTRVSVETGMMVSEVTAGDSILLPVQVMNLGKGMIYNVRCNVEGSGLVASKSLFIGNLESGTAGSGELNLFAGMINPDADKEEERYGDAYGVIRIIYEDSAGNEYVEEQSYATRIMPLVMKEAKKEDGRQKEKNIGKQLISGAIVVIFILAIGLSLPLLIQKRKEKKDIREEEE